MRPPVQVQLLQRQAAGSRETERGAALAGIIRQREEQLVAAHLEMAQLQVGGGGLGVCPSC